MLLRANANNVVTNYTFIDDSSTGMFRYDPGQVGLSANGMTVFVANTSIAKIPLSLSIGTGNNIHYNNGSVITIANAGIQMVTSGSMLMMQQSSNTAGRNVNFTNEGLVDGYSGIRARIGGIGGTTGAFQFTSADAIGVTIDPYQGGIHASNTLNLGANGVFNLVSITNDNTSAVMSLGGANTTLFTISSNAIISMETTAATGVRVGRQAGSIGRLTVFYPGTTSAVMDINGPSEMVTLGANVGLSLGSAYAPAANDLSRHIALYGTSYGMTVTGSSFNIVAPPSANVYIVSSADSSNLFTFNNTDGFLTMGVAGGGVRVSGSDSATAPGFSWAGDTDTGFYHTGTNSVGLTANGALVANFQPGLFRMRANGVIRTGDGNATAPGFTFENDTDNGMYRRGTNSIGFSAAGVEAFYITAAGIPTFPVVANTAAAAFNVSMNANGAIFKTSSSIRTKTDVEDLDYASSENFIRMARPVWYRSLNAIDRTDWSFIGLIAEEVDQIEPRFVAYSADETDENGFPVEGATLVPETVDYARMVVPLIQVVQKLLERVNLLEAQVIALQGN
jgi:hypothetical protein